MAIFPKIQSPCPYKSNLSAMMDGDICRMCKREVVDINAMSDDERVALIAGCETEICVSYKLPVGPVIAAALAATALAAPGMAAAQSAEDVGVWDDIILGGIKDPATVSYISTEDRAIPELPVVYEAEKPAATASKPAVESTPDAVTAAAKPVSLPAES